MHLNKYPRLGEGEEINDAREIFTYPIDNGFEEVTAKAIRALTVCGSLAVWGERAELVTTKKKLAKVQRLACICISGAMRTCPTGAMEVLLDLTPLHLVVERAAREGLLRIGDGDQERGNRINPRDPGRGGQKIKFFDEIHLGNR